MPLDHTPGPLQAHFAGHSLPEQAKLWDSLYEKSFTPWDRGQPSLALYDLLVEHSDLFGGKSLVRGRTRTALVPGCGRGWDVLLLAAHGFRAVGLDTSELAIEQAKKLRKAVTSGEAKLEEEYAAALRPRDGVGSLDEDGAITWTTGDFFKDDWLRDAGSEKFDLIFDYTFLCALPPSGRPSWAKRMSELLAPDGHLVCLELPLDKPLTLGGPPWPLSELAYLAHLSQPGEEIAYDSEGRVDKSKLGSPTEGALARIARIKPTRDHNAGLDEHGNVVDWISVWIHSDAPTKVV